MRTMLAFFARAQDHSRLQHHRRGGRKAVVRCTCKLKWTAHSKRTFKAAAVPRFSAVIPGLRVSVVHLSSNSIAQSFR
jgi:hypothetical protein